jgi:uncharacterized protein YbjT (DUF2867 family)
MRAILFGGTGMVGAGVLRECLADPAVDHVLAIGRRPTGAASPKLEEIVRPDLADLAPVADRLRGYDAAFFCAGVSAVGRSEDDYRRVTRDLTVGIGTLLARANPGALTFVYVSGAGTDPTGRRRAMWARVKGETETALRALPFRAAYMFRPGVIQPRHGIRSRTAVYRLAYLVLSPVVGLMRLVAPNSVTTTDRVGRAMIEVAEHGAPAPEVGTREINRLAAARGAPAAAGTAAARTR